MYEIKLRKEGATAWELVTVPQAVGYNRKKVVTVSGRTMDGTAHESVSVIKSVVSLTFNDNLTAGLIQSLYDVFSHTYVEMMYHDPLENKLMIKHFKLSEEMTTSIQAWNDQAGYIRYNPITLTLEER